MNSVGDVGSLSYHIKNNSCKNVVFSIFFCNFNRALLVPFEADHVEHLTFVLLEILCQDVMRLAVGDGFADSGLEFHAALDTIPDFLHKIL